MFVAVFWGMVLMGLSALLLIAVALRLIMSAEFFVQAVFGILLFVSARHAAPFVLRARMEQVASGDQDTSSFVIPQGPPEIAHRHMPNPWAAARHYPDDHTPTIH